MQISIHSVNFDADKKLLYFTKENDKVDKFIDELISCDIFLRIENSTDRSNLRSQDNSGFNELFASKKCET